jgi:LysM repeat protein
MNTRLCGGGQGTLVFVPRPFNDSTVGDSLGSRVFLSSGGKARAKVRVVVFTIVVLHVVFLAGLLIHGVRREQAEVLPIGLASGPTQDHPWRSPELTAEPAVAPVNPPLALASNLSETSTPPDREIVASHEHTIVKGENLSKIAKAGGVTVEALIQANPGVNPLHLQIGQKIRLPSAE